MAKHPMQPVAESLLRENEVWGSYPLELSLEMLLKLSRVTGDSRWAEHVMSVVDRRQWTPTTVVPYRTQPFSCLTFAIHEWTQDDAWLPVFLEQTDLMQRETVRSKDGAVLHPRQRGQGYAMLIDSMQGYIGRLAKAASAFDNDNYIRECGDQLGIHRRVLRDTDTGLWRQGRGWLDDETRLSPGAWSRGHGWLLQGIVDVLSYLPPVDSVHKQFRSALGEVVDALLAVQDPGGMWHCLLHRPHRDSAPEFSGTAIIAYHMVRAIHSGWLTGKAYRDAALKALDALRGYVRSDGQVINVSPGPGPLYSEADYMQAEFPAGDSHGKFAAIMAWIADEMIRRSDQQATDESQSD